MEWASVGLGKGVRGWRRWRLRLRIRDVEPRRGGGWMRRDDRQGQRGGEGVHSHIYLILHLWF